MTGLRRTVVRLVFAAAVGIGLLATWVRITRGLAGSTHLSDSVPWGLWIALDLTLLGLAGGGFVMAASVHVLGLHRLRPAVRPAILTALLGYTLGTVALAYDLGRPSAIWHPLVQWNPRSVMFEVAWCVMLYLTVILLEFGPAVLERLGWERSLRRWRAALPFFAFVGALLSLSHQSSLGALFLVVPQGLHPLWYSPMLPICFLLSATGAGCAMTLVAAEVGGRIAGRPLDGGLRESLLRFAAVVLGLYGIVRVADVAWRGVLMSASPTTLVGAAFLLELGVGVALPAALTLSRRVRRSRWGALSAALAAVAGLALNRLNVSVVGLAATRRVGYFPSWAEFAVTAMILAVGLALFRLAARHLPVFDLRSSSAALREETT